MSRWGVALAIGALLGAAPARARADDKAAAAAAYDRGQRAFDAGRFREAAEEFRTADRLSPSAPALEAAIESGSRTDDPGLVMELCDIADARPGDAHLEGVARDARIRFEGRAGKLLPRCSANASPPPCSLRIGNEPWTPGVARWIAAGDHVVVVDRGRGEERFAVPVGIRTTVEWSPPEPPPSSATSAPTPPAAAAGGAAPAPPPRVDDAVDEADDEGVSPAWFFVALGGTVVLGGVATGTGLATLSEHDAFEAAPTQDGRDSGLLLQNTTNGLLAGAAVCGVATIVLAFVVDWSGGEPASTASSRGITLSRF